MNQTQQLQAPITTIPETMSAEPEREQAIDPKKLYFKRRMLLFLVGIVIYSYGSALITKAELGISPLMSIMYYVSLIAGVSLGTAISIVNFLFFVIQALWLGKEFTKGQFLMLVSMVLFSTSVDLTMNLANLTIPTTLPGRIAVLLISIVVMAIGLSMFASSGFAMPPGDGMSRVMAYKRNMEFGKAKAIIDTTVVAITTVLCLITFKELRGVHIGTLVSALSLGNLSRLLMRFLREKEIVRW